MVESKLNSLLKKSNDRFNFWVDFINVNNLKTIVGSRGL